MDPLLQDLRYALRGLAANSGFAVVAALTLALGIGANTAIFSLVEAAMLRPLPFAEPERLVQVWQTQLGNDEKRASPANFLDWRSARSFSGLASYDDLVKSLAGPGEPRRVIAQSVSANFFAVLGVRPERGRAFVPGAEGPRQAVLSHALWRELFGTSAIRGGGIGGRGRVVRLDREPFEVVGVMPAGFDFPRGSDLWIQAPHDVPELPMPYPGDIRQMRDAWYFRVVGRLAPGVPIERAQGEMAVVARRLERAYPQANAGLGVRLVPLQRQLAARARPLLLTLLGAVGFVLLIACANVGNLLLARAARRRAELAVRSALGAGRGRLVRQLLTESLVISLAGAALGLAFAAGAVRLLGALPGLPGVPTTLGGGLGAPVLAFTLGIACLSALLFGLAPALGASRVRLAGALQGAGVRTAGPGGGRLRGALVVGQVALAVVLVAGAGLMVRSLWSLQHAALGFDPGGVLAFEVSLPGANALSLREHAIFYGRLVEEVAALPGVASAGAIQSLPLTGSSWRASLRVEGRPFDPQEAPDVCWRVATPGYFATLRIPLRRGRLFTAADRAGAPPVALVNETLARKLWPGRDPLGRRIATGLDGEEGTWATVVGVIGDTPQESAAAEILPEMVRPAAQETRHGGGSMMVVARLARAQGDPMALAGGVREAVHRAGPEAPISDLRPMADVALDSIGRQRAAGQLLGAFALLALALAAVGLYGLTAFLAAERTREMGLRAALGARRGDLLRLVLGRVLGLAAGGAALGVAGALALTRTLSGLLYRVAPDDPATLAAVLATLLAAATLASLRPALRAARVDPATVLRGE